MEYRESDRTPYDKPVDFSVSVLEFEELKSLSLKAAGIDISRTGLGVRVNYPLEPGHVLKFNSGMEHKTGIVKWSRKIDNTEYRIGIKFV